MIAKFGMYLQFPFVRYALIVSVLVALCSALLGVTLVLRRFSFIGDGLSHVAFGAMSVATVMNLTNEMLLILPVTVISAILLLRRGKNAKIKGDAAIAMISVAALAFGYLLVNVFSASSNISGDVCSTLFGSTSILTLSKYIRRRVQHPVRLHLHPDAVGQRGLAQRDPLRRRGGDLRALLQ